ncbi:hypothetical protein PRK78_001534 [Emydomyces testavorans]|uniref:Uncharacterized protein n=1 Tax=Emydomyces testavorans TaxID=2070801 RepID=A0AAF0IIS1_9EURO|nr:hypothetical protein PRK78_001534 [Emydomyces testavorans]
MESRSHHSRARRFDRPLNEPTLAQRTAAFRQFNRLPRQSQRISRQTTSIDSRSSLPSQPVVVRTYCAETDSRDNMSRQASSPRHNMSAKLPPVQDFGIDGILRAIEPDIQSTLDAIAEICGRSKLSLANEYRSHRPPLGEIRAPARMMDHGLLAVEEASSSNERLADENVLIVGDDISTIDGRDPYSSRYSFLDNMHPNTGALDYRIAFAPWGESEVHGAASRVNPTPIGESESRSQSQQRETKSSLTSFPWALLGGGTDFSNRVNRQSIQTQPVISEVHVDAQASGTNRQSIIEDDCPLDPPTQPEASHTSDLELDKSMLALATKKLSSLSDLRGVLHWFRHACQQSDHSENAAFQSAESKLQELLRRQDAYLLAMDERSQVLHAGAA